MEFVVLSDTVLRYLARDDLVLKRVFWDVVPSDGLPQPPSTTTRVAYIVNRNPTGEPGKHWLAVWTEAGRGCEVFDSYGLSLLTYPAPGEWLAQWPTVYRSGATLQALQSHRAEGTCLRRQYIITDQDLDTYMQHLSPPVQQDLLSRLPRLLGSLPDADAADAPVDAEDHGRPIDAI